MTDNVVPIRPIIRAVSPDLAGQRHHEGVPAVFNAIDQAMTSRGVTNQERAAMVGEAAFTWLELLLGDPALVADLFVRMNDLRQLEVRGQE